MIDVFTLIKILPFSAVITFELLPLLRTTTEKFEATYKEDFTDQRYQVVDEDPLWEDTIREEIGEVDRIEEIDIEELATKLDESTTINDQRLLKFIKDFVKYADDWSRARASIFATFLSVLATLSGEALSMPNHTVAVLILLVITLMSLLLVEKHANRHFVNYKLHQYGRDQEDRRTTTASRYIIGANVLIVVVVLMIDTIPMIY